MTDLRPFDVDVAQIDDRTLVRLRGELDAGAVGRFEDACSAIRAARSVEVDLGGVTLLDSAGGALLRLRRDVGRQGEFRLRAPREFQQRLFAITGLGHVISDDV